MTRALGLALVLLSAKAAHAHDLAFDAIGTATTTSENNPRAGSVGASLSGAYDFNDAWSAWGGFTYTRDLATRTADTFSPGSNVFLLTAGGMFLASDRLSFSAAASFSPSVTQDNATTLDLGQTVLRRNTVDLNVRSVTSSFGGTLGASWLTAGDGPVEGAVDATVGATRYNSYQVLQLPNTLLANQWRQSCLNNPGTEERLCPLVTGARTPLTQVRLGLTGTLTLSQRLDLGLDASVYLYDADPNAIGYFSVVALGRTTEFGNGVPVAPLRFTARPFAGYRFERLSLKLSYQYGLFMGGLGGNHVVTLKAGYRLTPAWRLSASLTGQADGADGKLSNVGAVASLGVVWIF